MRHAIIIISDELKINKFFMDYVLRSYESHFGELGEYFIIDENDKNLPFILEKHSNNFQYITIFASNKSYFLVAKILSTLKNENMELKDQTIAPASSLEYQKDSFVVDFKNSSINVVKAVPCEKLPNLLIQIQPNSQSFIILDEDQSSVMALLDPLTSTYDVDINLTKFADLITFVKATTGKFGQLDGFVDSAKNLFGYKLILDSNIAWYLGNILIKKGLYITFAESCTAGMCASMLGELPGISNSFVGSVVTYSNHIKHEWIGVEGDILNTYGAVSKECVEQMCKGVLELCDSDFSVAISGIAGPDGGSDEKPVGTVFVAVGNHKKIITKRLNLKGDRNYIRMQSALNAFAMLVCNFAELQE